MTTWAAQSAGLALVALAAGNVQALGLGEAVGHAVLGQPLRVEIALLGAGGNLPSPDCFRVRAPVAEMAAEFVLRNGRVQVVGDRGVSKLIVTSANTVREPLVGFAITAKCGFELTKDYMLLTALPAESPPPVSLPAPVVAPVAPVVAAPVVAAPAVAPQAPTPAVKAALALPTSDNLLRVTADVTLEALARQKYPAQPKAREKFMRMMARANPGLQGEESVIAAGTELQLPPGLPQVRVGPYQGEAKPAETKAAAKEAPAATPEVAAPQARPAKANPGKDRLVLGAGAEMSKAKLTDEVERLTSMLAEQTQSQEALTESLTKLEGRYGELQKNFARVEERIARIEAERLAEKQAPKPVSFDFLELLFAVLAGGAVGGLLLPGVQRWQRRSPADAASAAPTDTLAAIAAVLPWAKSKTAAATAAADEPSAADAATATPTPAMPALDALLPAAEAAAGLPAPEVVAQESLLPEPEVAAGAVVVATADESASDLDSLSLEFALEPQPDAVPAAEYVAPAAEETPEPVAVAAMAESSDLDDFSLDFPPIPTAGAADAAVTLAAATAAPDLPPLEPLSLDFPPIVPDAAAAAEDPHVIEFAVASVVQEAPAQNTLEFPKG